MEASLGRHARLRRVALAACLAGTLLAAGGTTGAEPPTAEGDPPPISDAVPTIVELAAPSGTTGLAHIADAFALRPTAVEHRLNAVDGFVATLGVDEIARLRTDPRVRAVHPGRPMEILADPGDPAPYVKADLVQNGSFSYRGDGWTVAVIDSGVDTDHPTLIGTTGTGINGRGDVAACFTADSSCPGGTPSSTGAGAAAPCTGNAQQCRHGTGVAGAAIGDGASSGETDWTAPDAGLYPIRVMDESGGILSTQVVMALDHVWSQRENYRFAAVNMSLGIPTTSATACDATSEFTSIINQLTSVGIAVVTAAGNDALNDGVHDPACVENSTTVSGVFFRQTYTPGFPAFEEEAGTIWSQSNGGANIGEQVDVMAPAHRVRVPLIDGGAGEDSGTSIASPIVAGAYALLRDACPTVPLGEITAAITSSPNIAGPLLKYPTVGATIRPADPNARTFPILDVEHARDQLWPAELPGGIGFVTASASATSTGSVELSWSATAGANGYLITDTLTGETLEVGDVTSVTWDDRPPGTRAFTIIGLADGCRHPGPATGSDPVTVVAEPDPDPLPVWTPLPSPARLVDTRPGEETIDDQNAAEGRFAAGEQRRVTVAGRAGVPPDAAGAIVNVTAIQADDVGFVTVHPCLDPRPVTASLNYTAGVNLGNEIVAGLSAGDLCIYSSAGAHLTVDVSGYVPTGSPYVPIAPARYLDTRPNGTTFDGQFQGAGTPSAGGTVHVGIGGRGAVPADAEAAVVYVSGVRPSGVGFETVWDCSAPQPLASSLNYVADVNRGNEIVAGLGAAGELCVYTEESADITLDVVGYLPAGTNFELLDDPTRIVDTRDTGILAAGGTLILENSGALLPPDAETATMNITAVRATDVGFVTAYPCAADRPTTASLNYVPGVNGGNEVIVAFDDDDRACFFVSSSVHLTVDVTGSTTPV